MSRINDEKFLKGYWPLSNSAKDFSGNNNHGVWFGTAPEAYTSGQFGKDVGKFVRGTPYSGITVSSLTPLIGDHTLSCRIYPRTVSGGTLGQGIIGKWNSSLGTMLYIDTDSKIKFYNNLTTAIGPIISTNSNSYHIVGVRSGTSIYIYVDGKLQGSNTAASFSYPNDISFEIGIYASITTPTVHAFPGNIENARYYNTALSPSEVKELYQQDTRTSCLTIQPIEQPIDVIPDISDPSLVGAWLNKGTVGSANDLSGNGRNGTASNVQWEKTGGRFNGVDSRILASSSDLIGIGDVTVMATIKPRGWGGGSFGRIVDNSNFIWVVDSDGSGRFRCTSANFNGVSYSGDSSILLNKYYVTTVTRTSAGIVNFYINGVLSGTSNQSSGTPLAGSPTYIGNNSTNTRNFDGIIKDLRVYNKILTPSEIQRLYRQSIPDDNILCYLYNGKDYSRYNRQFANYKVQVGNGVMRFNGSATDGNYLSTTDFLGISNFTTLIWFRANSIGGGGLGRLFTNGKIVCYVKNGAIIDYTNNNNTAVSTASSLFTYPQWICFSVVRNGSLITLYKNGLQIGEANQNAGTPEAATLNFIVGNTSPNIRTFDGSFGHMIFWNKVLTPSEIKNEYDNTKGYY